MAKKNSKVAGGRPGPGWFTKSEMASIFDLTQVYFDKEIRKLAPAKAVQQVGRQLWFHARSILDAWAQEKFGGAGGDEDEMLAGPPSDQLEEYRKHKARIAKVEADKKESMCIYSDEITPAFGKLTTRLMQTGEQLKDQFGNDAVDIFNEGVREAVEMAMRAIESSFDGGFNEQARCGDAEPAAGVGGAGDGAAPADAPGVCGAGAGASNGAAEAAEVSK